MSVSVAIILFTNLLARVRLLMLLIADAHPLMPTDVAGGDISGFLDFSMILQYKIFAVPGRVTVCLQASGQQTRRDQHNQRASMHAPRSLVTLRASAAKVAPTRPTPTQTDLSLTDNLTYD